MFLHKAEFVDWRPSGVQCIMPNKTHSRLAVGRKNGDIEIWDTTNVTSTTWRPVKRLSGIANTTIQSIVWTSPTAESPEGRLFSCGLHAQITEWDLARLRPKIVFDAPGGACWSMSLSPDERTLALGSEDGVIRLLEVTERELVLRKSFHKQEGRMLVVQWHPTEHVLYSAGLDGFLRRWDASAGMVEESVELEKAKDTRSKIKDFIWSIVVLEDHTVFATSSGGHVYAVNGQVGAIDNSWLGHFKDAVACVATPDQQVVFTAGVDRNIQMFRRAAVEAASSSTEKAASRWTNVAYKAVHSHDIFSLAIVAPTSTGPAGSSSTGPIRPSPETPENQIFVVSAGIDTQLVLDRVSEFREVAATSIFKFPTPPPISVARKTELVLVQQDTTLQLMSTGKARKPENLNDENLMEGQEVDVEQGFEFLLEYQSKGNLNIVCSAISDDATFMAFSNIKETKVYSMVVETDILKAVVSKHKPLHTASAAHHIRFTPDSSKMILATPTSHIQIYDLESGKLVHTFSEHANTTFVKQGERKERLPLQSISHITISDDGARLATADFNNTIHVFNLESMELICTAPRPSSPLVALSLSPDGKHLLMPTASNEVFVFDIETRQYVPLFSARMHLPRLRYGECIQGCSFMPQSEDGMKLDNEPESSVFCVYTDETLLFASLQEFEQWQQANPPKEGQVAIDMAEVGIKSWVANTKAEYVNRRKILNFTIMNRDDLLVVMRPWKSVLSTMPEPVYTKKFGA